jgi:hypothetical protein
MVKMAEKLFQKSSLRYTEINPAEPEWIRLNPAVGRFGLSKTHFYNKIADGTIRTKMVTQPGRSRGCRLLSVKSIREYLSRFTAEEGMTDYDEGYRTGYVAGLKKHLEQVEQIEQRVKKAFDDILKHLNEHNKHQDEQYDRLQKQAYKLVNNVEYLWNEGFECGYSEGRKAYEA